ncbi:hypothetical protein GALMADRAFT_139528 [Galerina marginata CBS 339.88]|uniref:Uncharacterized protein n=1 Tax=Galerina marginata (strain CBS 339.88) TaxID=685588 RepID=A0A067T098_GALM3|nr:hypothetical protein GALMADRAFT_139528 [Galerina marginata CBS 339.88]
MEYLRNNLPLPFRQPNHSDIELDDIEAGNSSAHQAHPLNPSNGPSYYSHPLSPDTESASNAPPPNLDSGPAHYIPPYADSVPAPYAPSLGTNSGPGSNTNPQYPDSMSVDNSHQALQPSTAPFSFSFPSSVSSMILSGALPLLPPIEIAANSGKRRMQNNQGINKVRVVQQTSQLASLREVQQIGQQYEEGFTKKTREYQEMADERLKQAEQQLAEANRRADEATKQAGASKVYAEQIAKRSEELSQQASKQLSAAIARAEEAEKLATATSREAEERFQNALESATRSMEEKLADVIKRLDGNGNRGQAERMDVDNARSPASRHGSGDNTGQWRERKENDSEDGGSDPEDETVANLLLSRPRNAGRSVHTELGVDEEHSVAEHSEGNTVPDSTVPDGDSDDGMGAVADDQEPTAAQKGKGKEITVPPPRKFHQTKGGANPANINMNTQPVNHVRFADSSSGPSGGSSASNQPPASPMANTESMSSPRLRQRHSNNHRRGPAPIFGMGAEDSRSSRPSDRHVYPQSKLRGFTTVRKTQLAAVRDSMNRLMHIQKDKDVILVESATEEEVEEFDEGTIMVPELDPMRPFLESSKSNIWNNALCDMFTAHFADEMAEQGVQLTDEALETVEAMFLDRLVRLSRLWREARKFTSEDLSERKKRSNTQARRNTRRVDLYNDRLEICYGNLKNRDNSVDPGWKVSAEMIEELGPAGMSSDESEVDEETKKITYRIRRRHWRSKACKERLLLVDSDRNITNALGGARPGKQPRERIRSSGSTISKRAPTIGCPTNYYSREWVANLSSERMVRALKMKRKKELGNVQVN